MRPLTIAGLALAAFAAGCSATVKVGDVSALTCNELDAAIARTAQDMSSTAIVRGRVDSYDPPRWLLGAGRAREAIAGRQTRKLDEIGDVQSSLVTERKRRCG